MPFEELVFETLELQLADPEVDVFRPEDIKGIRVGVVLEKVILLLLLTMDIVGVFVGFETTGSGVG